MRRGEKEKISEDVSFFCYGIKLNEQATVASLQSSIEKETGAVIQALNSKFILDRNHAKLLLYQTHEAYLRGISIARKKEIDILLRALCTKKINKALKDAAFEEGSREYVVLGFCDPPRLKTLKEMLGRFGELDDRILEPTQQKIDFLRSYHNITDLEIENYNLAYLLCEKSASGLAKHYKMVG